MLPYIASPLLKKIGATIFVLGIAAGGALAIAQYFSGEHIATVQTTQPYPKIDLAQQALQAKSQSVLQNTMNKMGVPTLRTDEIQTLNLTFQPIYLAPEMGEVRLQFDITVLGISAPTSNIRSADQSIRKGIYTLAEQKTGKVVLERESYQNNVGTPYDGNHIGSTHYNAPNTKPRVDVNGHHYVTIGMVKVPTAGNYILNAKMEKYKYLYPIDDIKLVAKKGTLPLPGIATIAGLIGSVILGYFMMLLATPPEKRVTKKSHTRNS